ncbi:MAG: hypothetical protein ERJ67_03915 [Aphanocapsa feldmannii 277cV]|uniref:Uncharacterized protein n=2 Tax=Aphanocapsa feldmannii TaxID=192050 RepID=A0A524RPN8_9CHRO|nr:MAG: hypothetical protein ERJ69_01350 [Aphanocapsa feldmannii 288cV]TGG93774.1 MAG: hypothetical protein ERJ67_03915 [Aphanocapsa feldmannii 277cV]TGH20191.1 MAG: hypothetical protein ERJ68_07160 [Aphanocapsa feldmannii 277cI]
METRASLQDRPHRSHGRRRRLWRRLGGWCVAGLDGLLQRFGLCRLSQIPEDDDALLSAPALHEELNAPTLALALEVRRHLSERKLALAEGRQTPNQVLAASIADAQMLMELCSSTAAEAARCGQSDYANFCSREGALAESALMTLTRISAWPLPSGDAGDLSSSPLEDQGDCDGSSPGR